MILKLNEVAHALFLGLYLLRLTIPNWLGEFVIKHRTPNHLETSIKHVFSILKNGNMSSPELRTIVLTTMTKE